MKASPLVFFCAVLGSTALTFLDTHAQARPEALEITAKTGQLLPRGKEADGNMGDFLLRNDRVEAVISGNLPLRRANMSTFYGADGITPGCLYDLTLRGANNDQITIFTPAQQQGMVSWVRVLSGEEEVSVECVVTAETGGGIFRRHLYSVRDGWQGIKITTTLKNETSIPLKTAFQDRWTNFTKTGVAPGGILWADSVDPADRCGYAVGPLEDPSGALKRLPGELQPGETLTYTRFLGVGTSPAAAVGAVCTQQGGSARLAGSLLDAQGLPVSAGAVFLRPMFAVLTPVSAGGKPVTNNPDSNGRLAGIAYPDKEGRFECTLPPGRYKLTATAPGRPDTQLEIEALANALVRSDFKLGPVGSVRLDVRDEAGISLPCKAQFLAQAGTEAVNLGPEQRAHGCRDQYHSEKGQFDVALPPGQYKVIVTRGIEYGHLEQNVEVTTGKPVLVQGVLKRLVDTKGWVSADYHNHTTQSGDNVCGVADRLINLAAEHIEFAPATEHNRIFDWRPEINRLGLAPFLQTVVGMENTGKGEHFNAFPFEPVPFTQDAGAPVWNADPRLTALTLREWQKIEPDRWVQINHPNLWSSFFEERGTGDKEGGFAGLVRMVDGYETQNGAGSRILDGVPFHLGRGPQGGETVVWDREFLWLQMLNQGRRTSAMAVMDAHSVFGNGCGGWRMYLPSASDDPSKIDWRENVRAAKAGCSYLTTGPFLQVSTLGGELPGATVRAEGGSVTLKVSVQCTDWIDIDRVQVLVNGRAPASLNFTRSTHPNSFRDGVLKFEREIKVPLKEDAHLIVVACSESSTLQTGYGSSSQSVIRPLAYHNPLFVDVDANGFQPNGDSLGFPQTGKKVTLEQAKQFLSGGQQP
jgi:hypothetical protein